MGGGAGNRGRAVILGMARSGRSAARLLLSEGYGVMALDRNPPPETVEAWEDLARLGPLDAVWGEHPLRALEGARLLVRSPGIPADAPFLQEARHRGIDVVSELELAFLRATGPVIAGTGTNGKSTTIAWLAHTLGEAGRPAVACGNIGRAFGDAVLDEAKETVFVVEVSSFQLEDIRTFRPEIGILLNITPDHLDRYASLDAYAAAKWSLFRNQTADDWAVLPPGLEPPHPLRSRPFGFGGRRGGRGVVEAEGALVVSQDGRDEEIIGTGDLSLPGPHNQSNAMAVAAAASAFGLAPREIAPGLRTFEALPHRMEPVGEIDGVLWVNDSKATNLDSLSVALQSYRRPVVLIAGGRDKGADFGALAAAVESRVRHVVVLGEAAETIRRSWDRVRSTPVASMDEAVRVAASVACSGDVVLLSPGCASQDMFRDYQERGDVFRDLVRALARPVGGEGP